MRRVKQCRSDASRRSSTIPFGCVRVALALLAGLAGTNSAGTRAASAAVVPSTVRDFDAAYEALERVPRVSAANVRGYGALAIRQGRDLYILDGNASAAQAFRRVEHGAVVGGMTWSPDGRWLAYVTSTTVWIVGRRAKMARRLNVALAPGDSFVWSPRADVLCVVHATGESYRPPVDPKFGYPGPSSRPLFQTSTVTLIEPNGRERVVAVRARPDSLRWTSDGRNLAAYTYTAIEPWTNWPQARFDVYKVNALRGEETLRARSVAGGQLAFAALVPHSDTLLYWRGSVRSGSVAADGQELWLNSAPGAERGLGTMLENSSWMTFSPDARQFVFVAGPGREAQCRPLPLPANRVAVDPRWSPQGARVAFVRGVDDGANGGHGLQYLLAGWIGRRVLWLQMWQPARRTLLQGSAAACFGRSGRATDAAFSSIATAKSGSATPAARRRNAW